MTEYRSAIPPEEVVRRPLSELTALDFIAAISSSRFDQRLVGFLPEKKKIELWTDESGIGGLNLADLFDRLRGEKKKLELAHERDTYFGDALRESDVIEQIAEVVAQKLRTTK